MIEEWKPIPGFEDRYAVSNQGRVMRTDKGNILTPRPIKAGYLRIKMNKKDFYIHRLVAEMFCTHPSGCDVVNHLDNDPTNNNADNLEWTTQLKNVHYGMKQKRYHINAVPVVGYKDGERHFFMSARLAGKVTGCDHSGIVKCCKGKYATYSGYKWEYAEVAL